MLYHISKLHKHEQELVKKAPFLVSILVAGADGKIETEEIEKAVKLIHTKTFTESSDIRHLYKEIDHDGELIFNQLLKSLPANSEEREVVISEELGGLNKILIKLEKQIAIDFYKSLKSFALRVAQNSGGVFGMMQVNYHEKELIQLPMIKDPSL